MSKRTRKPGLRDAAYAGATLPFRIGRRLFLSLVGTATATAAAGCKFPSEFSDVEFIVIGSGAGGGPLAANLARSGHKVLLFEAGSDRGATPTYQIPRFHRFAAEDPTMSWAFWVKHYGDPARQAQDPKTILIDGDPRIYYPRAGTLGGCTSHNALFTVCPHEEDWNQIARITGDNSWNATNMRRYFTNLENCAYLPRDTPGHGFDGWFHSALLDPLPFLGDIYNALGDVLQDGGKLIKCMLGAAIATGEIGGGDPAFPAKIRDDLDTFVQATKDLYTLMRRDLNSVDPGRDNREGINSIPISTRDGRRGGPRDYLVDTANELPDKLRILTNTLVTRIVFDGNQRAIGVEYIDAPHVYRADPNPVLNPESLPRRVLQAPDDLPNLREIIIACGAYNTPQLLALSGVGPRDELAQLGIPVVVDSPGVGANLQDRYEVAVVSKLSADFPVPQCHFAPGDNDQCIAQWQTHKGPYISNGIPGLVVRRSTPDKPLPDLIILGVPGNFHGYYPGYSRIVTADARHWTWFIIKAHTNNHAGTVKLVTKNPWDMPDINFHSFDDGTTTNGADQVDLLSMVEAVKFTRQMCAAANQMVSGGLTETIPGTSVKTDADIADFVKKWKWGHHASCSAKLGADDDPMAVLDSNLNVRGTKGLRVVDACIFPNIPGFFPMVPIYMVAEKMTDVILTSIGENRIGGPLPNDSMEAGNDASPDGSSGLDAGVDAPTDASKDADADAADADATVPVDAGQG